MIVHGRYLESIVHRLYHKLLQLCHPSFLLLKFRTNGMLGAHVYRRIYDRVSQLPDHSFVEIGAASGAGTIVMARGYQHAGNRSRIVAVEKCQGGSRQKYGDYGENLAILQANLKRHGVSEQVSLFTRTLDEQSSPDLFKLFSDEKISGFMVDADGRLDRDFALLWPRTVENGLIIVDDCPQVADLECLVQLHGSSGKKLYMTAAGWAQIVEAGLVDRVSRVGETMFAYKPPGSQQTVFPRNELQKVVTTAEQEYLQALASIDA